MSQNNPPISLFLRLFTLFELFFLVTAGVGLFFLPDLIRPIWPWDIPPFNAAFIGVIYLASVPAIGMLALVGRWAPARTVLPMLMTFTGIGIISSLLNLNGFQFGRWATWLWFFIYTSLPLNSAVHLWIYRKQSPAQPIATSSVWRVFLWAQGIMMIIYGLGQFVAPVVVSAFWPWKIDAFHGQLYSGAFIATGIGGLLISRQAARSEFLAQALSQIGFGLLAVAGLLLGDSTVHRVDWGTVGTWVWIGGFALMAIAGLAMLWRWRGMDNH